MLSLSTGEFSPDMHGTIEARNSKLLDRAESVANASEKCNVLSAIAQAEDVESCVESCVESTLDGAILYFDKEPRHKYLSQGRVKLEQAATLTGYAAALAATDALFMSVA